MFNSCTTNRKTTNTGLEYQLDLGSSSSINSPNYLIAAHQTQASARPANKTNKFAFFDQVDVRRHFVQNDEV